MSTPILEVTICRVKPLFLGSHPALDFLNTVFNQQGKQVDVIGNGEGFVDWLVGAGLLDSSLAVTVKRDLGAQALDAAAAEARKVRAWAADWISRWRDAPGADYAREHRRLNSLLKRASGYRELVEAKTGWQVAERWRFDTADQLVPLVAAALALFVTGESAGLVKRCAGTTCTLWFLDRTKAHRRVFCSASACGNRAKVAAFRDRQRRR